MQTFSISCKYVSLTESVPSPLGHVSWMPRPHPQIELLAGCETCGGMGPGVPHAQASVATLCTLTTGREPTIKATVTNGSVKLLLNV